VNEKGDEYAYRLMTIKIVKIKGEIKDPIVKFTSLTDDEFLDFNLKLIDMENPVTFSLDGKDNDPT
jgi:hypothetical protein